MNAIDLQRNARPKPGRIECYWFENPHIGLRRTLFHRIVVPFAAFDTGLDHVRQPESPELTVEWLALGLEDPGALDGVAICMDTMEDVEASIYLGASHNHVDLHDLRLTTEDDSFRIDCRATVEFENQGVADNQRFSFTTTARFIGEAS